MVGTSQQGDRWWLELTVDSATMSNGRRRAGAELIVVHLSVVEMRRSGGYLTVK